MNKYIFRFIFYTTIILVCLALNLDYDNSSIQVILAFVSLISVGGVISYKVLRDKNIKEASKILGIPESFITE